ncbi:MULTISPECIES: helicase C-terminal domain-containing protein [Anaerolinea]|uniref:helicase C-terminal domain-containing protein n=1 Tax=Anaerolinea TaxID=233189 RepID=UPI0026304288|nr:helicase C-terminal domain-containing protein [Anaerolinea thermophila]
MPDMSMYVAIDIETTGLDPEKDCIIEIGAVRFSNRRVEEEWSTLVKPTKTIPAFITQLTGITNDMVRKAPTIQEVIGDLAQFVGNSPVVGHNIRFDLSFLQKQRILWNNHVIDTYELASVLLPTASRYNLGVLAQSLGILLPATHRALDDARVTHALFISLLEMAADLPVELLSEIVQLSEPLDWDAHIVFRDVLSHKISSNALKSKSKRQRYQPFEMASEPVYPLTETVDRPIPLNPDEIAGLLEHHGPFAHYFEQYEYRQQQVEMLREVCQALSTPYHLMVEAGTGTGKSFAYLIPAAIFAYQNNTRVVISTNTITLQDQLIKKDIPDLRNALNLDLRAVVLKGRSNYLCPRRLEALRQRGPSNADEMRVLAKVLVWLLSSQSGDRNEINLNGPVEREIWNRISAEDEGCKAEVCIARTGGNCPFYRARQSAQSAHLIIVNHALLLSDIATGNRLLPDYQYLIVDEAHHLEGATTNALSFRVSQSDILRLLKELGSTSTGLLGRLFSEVRQSLRPSDLAAFTQLFERATDISFRLENFVKNFFHAVNDFLEDQRDGHPLGGYGQEIRIIESVRTLPSWTSVEVEWDNTHETFTLLLNLLSEIYKNCSEFWESMNEGLQDTVDALASIYRRLAETDLNIHACISQPQQNMIYWIEIQPNGNFISINGAPLHIGPLMEQYIWHEKSSVILTSATLTANEGFDYIRNRLYADEANELQLGSPFDYESSALLYIVNDIPEPSDANGYQRELERVLVRLAKATEGRMLVLFTSYLQLKRTSQAITPLLADHGILVYEQGEGASTHTLLATFREAEKAVLLGTRAFWEGVDIPGEALSVLVIAKLPFDVPSDPIVAARAETFEDPFNEYHLPEAILRFRQGFGRLIRTQSDRGIVAVLDKRILTKRYGRAFIESLPTCTLKIGSAEDLPSIAKRWLNL